MHNNWTASRLTYLDTGDEQCSHFKLRVRCSRIYTFIGNNTRPKRSQIGNLFNHVIRRIGRVFIQSISAFRRSRFATQAI